MATLSQKIECEQRMRKLLRDNGMPEPDGVEYGFTCVRFFFDRAGACVVVDIDNSDDDGTLEDLAQAEAAAGADPAGHGYLEAFGDRRSDAPARN
ncbi:MAG TPA: hypothetical protein VF781_12745 [Solirubrobacteraceae bacterium]